MTATTALPALLALPDEEKRSIIDALWNSLEETAAVDAATRAMLDQRWAEHVADPESGMSVEAFRRHHASRRTCAD